MQTVFEFGVPFFDLLPCGRSVKTYCLRHLKTDREEVQLTDSYACCLSVVVTLRRGAATTGERRISLRVGEAPPPPVHPVVGEVLISTYLDSSKDRRLLLALRSKDAPQGSFSLRSQDKVRLFHFFYDRFVDGVPAETNSLVTPPNITEELIEQAKESLANEGILDRFLSESPEGFRYPFANGCFISIAGKVMGTSYCTNLVLVLISKDRLQEGVPVEVRYFSSGWIMYWSKVPKTPEEAEEIERKWREMP